MIPIAARTIGEGPVETGLFCGIASTVIVGRTSACGINGLDDAIARGRAFADAGVDALFFIGVNSAEEVAALGAAFDLPIVLGGALKIMPAEDLARHGVRMCLTGHPVLPAAVRAMEETLRAMREGRAPDRPGSAELMRRATRAGDYDGWIADYLGNAEG